jgi:hypothetical protein
MTAAPLCRYNYHFFSLATEVAFQQAEKQPSRAGQYMSLARSWCERSLVLNKYQTMMCWIETRLLWIESPQQAIRFWEEYTDWHFWEPYNHAMLATLYALSGDIVRAENELQWVKGTEYFNSISRTIADARSSAGVTVSAAPTQETGLEE